MNWLLVLIMVATTAAKFISYDEVEDLFIKFMEHRLTENEGKTLNDVFEILRLPQYISEHSREKVSKPQMSLRCFGCRVVAAAFFKGVAIGLPDHFLSSTLTLLCTILGIETYGVCKGAVELYVPILVYIIKNTPEAEPNTFCGLALQVADDPDACAYDDPRFDWHVDLPDPVPVMDKKRPISSYRNKPLKVALITDGHIDPLYKPYGVADCAEPACCRAGQTAQVSSNSYINESIYERSFIRYDGEMLLDLKVAAEIRKMRSHKRNKRKKAAPAGYWGDYRNCDTPLWTFDDVIDRISDTHKNVDVVYYIGDTIDHHVWETTYEQNDAMNSYMVKKIRRSFGDNVMVVLVIGNHESQPINQFASASISGDNLNTTWLYKSLAKKWKYYLPKNARATFLKRGEYSVLIRPGFRAITLNINVAYKYNWWQVYDPLDAKEHLDWLVNELHAAELAGEKVHILTHIPPGEDDLTYTWTREYNRIVNRFASTIAAEFNGHTHADEFRVFYSPSGQAVRVAWNAGGITTFSNFNPNYKIFKFHPFTFEPTNIENYIYNLTNANLTPKRRPHWFRLYDFTRKFRLPDLSPASMNDLVTRMVTNNKQLLDIYSDYFYKMSDARPQCDTDCKLEELCRTVVTVLWERQKCEDLKELYYGFK
ncbi:sphingomyelin phosphodiesterase 1-like isoform X1 [Cydia splendana]|uniref:sphingomyelin phosphodiesterase 1-like isoform X1 n=2 Tax=Cydia splendana TaxID=1100963 RepID=UPI00300C8F5E